MREYLTFTILIIFISCNGNNKKNNRHLKVDDIESKIDSTLCSKSTLIDWVEKTKKEKKGFYEFSKKVESKFELDNNAVKLSWDYNLIMPTKDKDEAIELILDLIKSKIGDVNRFELNFEYSLYAYCSSIPELGLEVNSEISEIYINDLESDIKYVFWVIRGRLDSSVMITSKSKNEKDTTYISY